MNGFENDWPKGGLPSSEVLKTMTDREFLVLGTASMAYLRQLDRAHVADLLPDVDLVPGVDDFHVLFAANGEPVMITDTRQAAIDWIDEQDADMAQVH